MLTTVVTDPTAGEQRYVLCLHDVSKVYGIGDTQHTVLNAVTLNVYAGSLTALVGPSGSGKSTLLNIAGGLERPTHGEVILAHQPIHHLPATAVAAIRACTVSYVFQEWNLIRTMTILENVCLPMELAGTSQRTARARAAEVLDLVDVHRHARKFPDQLSGGEQQRVAIARALADRRALLLADEPTGALDSDNGDRVIALLRKVASEGTACVVATHNPQIADAADRVVGMRDGRLVSDSAGEVS